MEQFFSLIIKQSGLSTNQWKLKIGNDLSPPNATGKALYYTITYPKNATWFMTITRNNGQIYTLSNNGSLENTDGFSTFDPLNPYYKFYHCNQSVTPFLDNPPVPSAITITATRINAAKVNKLATMPERPVRSNDDIQGSLRERLQIVYDLAASKLKTFKVYLFGSHLRGVSRSGSSDIDIVIYSPDQLSQEEKINIVAHIYDNTDFKIDLVLSSVDTPDHKVQFLPIISA